MDIADTALAPSRAEIITTGTEILLGDIVDTNAAWIAQQLRDAGINLYYKSTVGDNEARMRGLIELAISRSNLVIVTGGLGPTADDITRQAIAGAAGSSLVFSEKALADIQERFARFGVQMTDNNRQQALIPEGAIVIENPVGTAPGFVVEQASCAIIALPGVPREMKHLMQEFVLPYIRTRFGEQGAIRRRILRTIGIGESTIDSRLRDLMDSANPTVGLAAHTAQADVRIAARADSIKTAESLLDQVEAKIRERIGAHIYSTTADESIETVTCGLLAARKATLAIIETNTDGNITHRLRSAQEGNECIVLNKTSEAVEIPLPGTESDEDDATIAAIENRVAEMAISIRTEANATYGIAIVGTRGPGQGIYGNQRGRSWIAISSKRNDSIIPCNYGASDDFTLRRIGNQVLEHIWRRLVEER